eukprot:5236987-Amphidinium_carterae.1
MDALTKGLSTTLNEKAKNHLCLALYGNWSGIGSCRCVGCVFQSFEPCGARILSWMQTVMTSLCAK